MNRRTKRSASPTMDTVLRHARRISNRTQAQLAEDLGLSLAGYKRLLAGHRPTALGDLERMAKALGLRISVEYTGQA